MKKKTVIMVSVLSALFISFVLFLTIFLVNPYFEYINTHTWATITVRGEMFSDTNFDYELTQEYLKGDVITVGEVTLKITDISHSGNVDLKVKSGNLYDNDGNIVKKFTIDLNTQTSFQTDDGTVTFCVDSNRYQ